MHDNVITLSEVKKICPILRRSENTFSILQLVSMRNNFMHQKVFSQREEL